MDDLVRRCPRGGRAVRRPATARSASPTRRDQALGERSPVLADDLDRVVGLELALDAADAGGEQRPAVARRSARRAPSSTTTRPAAPWANAIQSLRLGSRCVARANDRADRLPLDARRATTAGRSAAAMTARTPDQAAIFAAASLLAIPPLPAGVPDAARRPPRARRRPRRSPRSATPRCRGADRR